MGRIVTAIGTSRDGYGFIYQRILGERSAVPFVPVFVDTFYEPHPPSAARCAAFGEALAEHHR